MPVIASDGTRGINAQTWIYCSTGKHLLYVSEKALTATSRFTPADWMAENSAYSDAPASRSVCPVCGSALLMAGVSCAPNTALRW